jgi:hypothetical protein
MKAVPTTAYQWWVQERLKLRIYLSAIIFLTKIVGYRNIL